MCRKINDKDVERMNNDGKLANYAATHDIGKLGIERYYEDVLHGQTGYEEVEVNNRGRVIRQLKEVPPQAGHDIYLTLDLKLQQYIETLLAVAARCGCHRSAYRWGILALVSRLASDPNLFVDGISSKDYSALLNDPNTPLVNRATQGGFILRRLQLNPMHRGFGIERRGDHAQYDASLTPAGGNCPVRKNVIVTGKWGHGRLNVTKIAGRICGYLLLSGGLRYGDRSPLRMDG